MAMKYVKLFEHWLLTEGEDDIEAFSPNSPKKFPVLNTTVRNYTETDKDLKIKLITSILQRSKQDLESDKFDINAGQNVNLSRSYAYYDTFDKTNEKKVSELASTARAAFSLPEEMTDQKVLQYIYNNATGKDDKHNYPKYWMDLYKVTDGSDSAVYFKIAESQPDGEENILNLKISNLMFSKGKEGAKQIKNISSDCTLGMLVLLINAGINDDNFNYLEKSAENKFTNLCKNIFGGEGLTNIGKFAKTVKIGGMELDLASGKSGDIIPLYVAKNIVGTCGFDFNKASLKEDGKATLSKKELWDLLADPKTKTIEIVGHTDSVGTEEVNLNLSKQRAETVLKFLQESPNFAKIKDKKITTTGVGFKEMVEDDKKGKNKDAAAKNRRIVIKINGVGPDYSSLIK